MDLPVFLSVMTTASKISPNCSKYLLIVSLWVSQANPPTKILVKVVSLYWSGLLPPTIWVCLCWDIKEVVLYQILELPNRSKQPPKIPNTKQNKNKNKKQNTKSKDKYESVREWGKKKRLIKAGKEAVFALLKTHQWKHSCTHDSVRATPSYFKEWFLFSFFFCFSKAIIATFLHAQQQQTPQIPQHYLTEKTPFTVEGVKRKKNSLTRKNIYMPMKT